MGKKSVDYSECLVETVKALEEGRVLLVSKGRQGRPNAMTIGWGTIGVIWGRPVFIALVRPSRYTFNLIDETGEFTVNVAPPTLKEAVAFCGTVSGKDQDKFKDKGLTAIPALKVTPPLIRECSIHFECRVVHKNDLVAYEITRPIIAEFYPADDFHRLFFGEILACQRDK